MREDENLFLIFEIGLLTIKHGHRTPTSSSIRDQFTREVVYLNTATCGLPPRVAHEATLAVERDRARGRLTLDIAHQAVERSRAAFARLVGVPVSRVAVGSQASFFVGLVAASLPPGATVVVAEEDFTSVTYPFLAATGRGVTVRPVPLDRIIDAVDTSVDLVSVSVVQSADGRIVDVPALLDAAATHGARVLLDTTQSSGWLPIPADRVDYLVCSAYKWLLGPRGACFFAGTDDALAELTPIAANWFAAEDITSAFYGTELRLASDARRFDLSPAWASCVGLAPALELLADLGKQRSEPITSRWRTGSALRWDCRPPIQRSSAWQWTPRRNRFWPTRDCRGHARRPHALRFPPVHGRGRRRPRSGGDRAVPARRKPGGGCPRAGRPVGDAGTRRAVDRGSPRSSTCWDVLAVNGRPRGKQEAGPPGPACWRWRWDLNPRRVAPHTLSRRAH